MKALRNALYITFVALVIFGILSGRDGLLLKTPHAPWRIVSLELESDNALTSLSSFQNGGLPIFTNRFMIRTMALPA